MVCIVFAVGVFVGNSWRSQSSSEISKLLRSSELDAESFLIEQELFKNFETNCDFAQKRLNSLSQELWGLGKVLGSDDAEQRLGSEDYVFLKRKYHLMQIRTFVLEKQLKEECGTGSKVILFYFKRNDPASREQGMILDELVDKYDLHIYAVELGYSKELKFLEDYYGIKEAPAIVFDFTAPVSGVVSREELIGKLNG